MSDNIFYNLNKTLSYNALHYYIIGERGVGKTYTCIKRGIKRFLTHGEQFIYVRRFRSEIDASKEDFFLPFELNNEFPDYVFFTKGNKGYCYHIEEDKKDARCCCFFLPLTTASQLKSKNYNHVNLIIFDEFLVTQGCYHYLKNEVVQFFEMVETISRLRDIPIFFLGNATSTDNPYFQYFNLSLPVNQEYKLFKNGLILVNYIKNLKYRKTKKRSKLGQILSGTSYEKYAIDNEWLLDNNTFIHEKTSTAKNKFNIKMDNQTYGVWVDYNLNIIFLSTKFNPTLPLNIALDNSSHSDNTLLTHSKTTVWWQSLRNYYENGCLYFENQHIKNEFCKIYR